MQRERYFAIVDEVDNILIDEARTPLIISGQAEESADLYFTFARLVPKLKRAGPRATRRAATTSSTSRTRPSRPTEDGIDKIEKLLGDRQPVRRRSAARPPLRAGAPGPRAVQARPRLHRQGRRDRHRRRVHRAARCPAAAGARASTRRSRRRRACASSASRVTLATITFQNYFRLYDKLAGMTGTAMTEAEEFHKIYNLEVVAIPTHRPMVRDDYADLVYRNETAKFNARHRRDRGDAARPGRPVLVGTVSVEKSEVLVDAAQAARASSTRCSTPSSTRRRRGSSPRPAAPAP